MKTMLLRDGDLVPSHRDFVMITGTGKVAQDLRCALLEPMGNDRFHTGWGSTLEDFLATIANEDTRFDVESEVNRVISNYVAVQRDKIEADIYGDTETRFTTSEIVQRIRSVEARIDADSVQVTITLVTVSGEVVLLSEGVS